MEYKALKSRAFAALAGVLAAFATLYLNSCGQSEGPQWDKVWYEPQYAKGFDIVGREGMQSVVLRVKCAWQDADSTAMELFIARNGESAPEGFRGQVIREEAGKLAVMSSSYIGFLSVLDACDRVAAVSGKRFISNPIALSEAVVEIGSDTNPDYEGLITSGADLVLVYGIASASPMEKKLAELGIPYFYMGEYLEENPLGRAEWVVAIAEILGCRERGEAEFAATAAKYNSLKDSVSALFTNRRTDDPDGRTGPDVRTDSDGRTEVRPKVMLNAPYGDLWFMASPRSAFVRIIEDAGGEYVFKRAQGNRSVPIEREEAFLLASEADFWLETGSFGSLTALLGACPGWESVECLKEGRVYNSDRRLSPGGGSEFWETAPARPELVLKDLIQIFHPELVSEGDSLYFYRLLP